MHKYAGLSSSTLDWILAHGQASSMYWYIARRNMSAVRFVTI